MSKSAKVVLVAVNKMSPEETAAYHTVFPRRPNRTFIMGRAFVDGKPVHVEDIETDSDYDPHTLSVLKAAAPYRTYLGIPILRDGVPIGVIGCGRREVRPFTEAQIALVENFAAQAVIAIENARLLSELRESLEQQTATSEVLSVISSSPGELEPVFKAMLENATRICGAKFGTLFRFDGRNLCFAAEVGTPAEHAEFNRRRGPFQPTPGSQIERVIQTKQLVSTVDLAAEAYDSPAVKLGGARSSLCVPMVKDDALVGTIVIYRQEVRPFTDKQIELVQNFAAQAVIAIENTRLLNELRESLEQQTATADVLRVISSSPGALEPVFRGILENAARICQAQFGTLNLYDGEAYHTVALHNPPPQFTQRLGTIIRPHPESGLAHVARTKQVAHIDDIRTRPPYLEGNEAVVDLADLANARTLLIVPMLKEGKLVGAISIYRQEVRLFADRQVELVRNFAAQAVIAIENARLLSELRQSLEQQTAAAEVLSIISSSPGDLEPVFQAMLENATRICEAKFGLLYLLDGERLELVAEVGTPPKYAEFQKQRGPFQPTVGGHLERVIHTKQISYTVDAAAEDVDLPVATLGGARFVAVPMLKDEVLIGVIGVYRQEVRPFTDKQIELVENFAAQAVIAIENTRLLSELRQRTTDLTESLEQQTATSEVLRAISSSPTNVQPVLDTIVRTAVSLCNSYDAVILLREGEHLRIAAHHGPMALDFERLALGRDFVSGRTVIDGEPVHVPDFMAAGAEFSRGREIAKRLKQRTVLGLPLRREGQTIGCLFLRRTEVLPFADKQIELLTTFADQAVIAIENVRLFEAEQQRTRELAKSLDDLRTAQDRLVQTQKLASLGQLTAGIAHEIKNPLNFVNNFSGLSVELLDELQEAVESGTFNDERRREIAELTDTLRGNLDKIAQHGKRAELDSQEHAAPFARRCRRTAAGQRQRPGRGKPQSGVPRRSGREAGLYHHFGAVLRSRRRGSRCLPARNHPSPPKPDRQWLLCGHQTPGRSRQ